MDFALSEEQTAILEAVDALLQRHAGAARAVEVSARPPEKAWDPELDAAIREAGFGDLAEEAGSLEAALLVERVARAAGAVAVGADALVAPLVVGQPLPGPVALAGASDPGPVRYAPMARSLLVADGDAARVVTLEDGDVEPVRSNFGYPLGRLSEAARSRGESLGPGSGERLLAWWRVALAAEALGSMDAALGCTVSYLSEREQFGRPIGSFQAVQHRLAGCAVLVEGTRWLVYEAAARGADPQAAATAAGYATQSASQVHRETHQLSGAIGYTTEHDLHVWSMRLQALRMELGGEGAHWRSLADQRWGAP